MGQVGQGFAFSSELKLSFYCSGAKITLVLRFFLWIQLRVNLFVGYELNAHSAPECHLLPNTLRYDLEEKLHRKSNKNCRHLFVFWALLINVILSHNAYKMNINQKLLNL